MDFFSLRWLCAAVLFIPLTVNANKVSTERVVGTTSYGVKDTTISKPSNTTFSPVRDVNPTPSVQRLPNGGLSQSASGNLYIAQKNGSRLSTPVKGAFNFAKNNLKSGAKSLFKTNPMSLVGTVGLMGLDKVLKESGLEPYGGILTKEEAAPLPREIDPSDINHTGSGSSVFGHCNQEPCVKVTRFKNKDRYCKLQSPTGDAYRGWFSNPRDNGFPWCTYGYGEGESAPDPVRSPVTEQEIDDILDSNYEPNEHDFPLLFPHIYPDSFSIDSVPSVRTPTSTSTTTSTSSGITTTIESFTDFEFDFDNSTDSPSITVTETNTDIKYENGEKVDETTTTTTNSPVAPLPDASGSGSGDKPPSFELPSFCSWASTVCNWIGWTQQMPDGEEPDLSKLLNDYEFEQTNTISFGSKQCPEPITLNLVLINKPVKITFDAFCALAGYLYFMVMASAYIIAARITLGVARG